MKLKWRKKNYCLMATGKSGLFYHISETSRGGCFIRIEFVNKDDIFNNKFIEQANDQETAKEKVQAFEDFVMSYQESNLQETKNKIARVMNF